MKFMRNSLLVFLLVFSLTVAGGGVPATGGPEFTILLTNDDGYRSPGLRALVDALKPIARIVVAAPTDQKSGVSMAITYREPIFVRKVDMGEGVEAYAVTAMPATAARVGLESLMEVKPDLVISGINSSENVGSAIPISGTVGAARQAASLGYPAIAISREGRADYNAVAAFVRELVEALRADDRIKPGLFLNVNVPAGEARGVRIVRQSMVRDTENYEKRVNPRGATYYWSRWKPATDESEETDIGALAQGYITITPLVLDQTDAGAMAPLRGLKFLKAAVAGN